MNVGNCSQLIGRPEHGTWFRSIQLQYLNTALQISHTQTLPSRFTSGKGTSVLYLAETPLVAQFEVEAMLGSPYGFQLPNPHRSWAILNVHVGLQHIADLTQTYEQGQVGTTTQELTGDWRGYQLRAVIGSSIQPTGGPAPTQELGETVATATALEGFIVPSAKMPTHRNLVIFPDQLATGSTIIFTYPDPSDPTRSITETIP